MQLPRALRVLGYALCAIIAAPEVIGWFVHHESMHGPLWLSSYAAFVVAYHLAGRVPAGARRWATVAGQEAAMIAMGLAAPCDFAALAMVVIALEVALHLPAPRLAIALVAQTVVVSAIVMHGCGAVASASWLLAMCGFQAAAVVAVLLARRELAARAELARANAELRAARELLVESSRADERDRIARELHDVLGHTLTALALQLEVAENVAPEATTAHVARAHELADDALAGVRGAVSAMREAAGPDVGAALRTLVVDIPGLHVDLAMPEPFVVESSAHAHCVLRCVQEIVTNALRHAGAQNLWIVITRDDERITVDARDDGRGAAGLREGNGLGGMRERIEEMGGRLLIAPTPTFSVRASLPIAEAT